MKPILTPCWLDTQAYPFRSRTYWVGGNRLHYIDEGKGLPLVFVHGTPSWSFEFREQIKAMRSTHRCVALDHMGFGLSDKPRHYDYSPRHHAQNLETWILDLDLKEITLILHDFGGPIGFIFALRHPGRISRILILNFWLWSMKEDPEFAKMARILRSPLLPFLYRYLNFSARIIMPRSFGEKKLDRLWRQHYTRPFPRPKQREGPLALALALVRDQDWFAELWDRRKLLADKPMGLIWGMKDPGLKPDFLDRFAQGFPGAVWHRLETAGHFPQEEEAEQVTKFICGEWRKAVISDSSDREKEQS